MAKYIDLTDQIARECYAMPGSRFARYVQEALGWLDRNPDQLPSRKITLTESEVEVIGRDAINYFKPGGTWADWARAVFMSADFPIVPDPEPTNAERIKALLKQAPVQSIDAWATYLNDNGVKAPGGDDE